MGAWLCEVIEKGMRALKLETDKPSHRIGVSDRIESSEKLFREAVRKRQTKSHSLILSCSPFIKISHLPALVL